MWYLQVCGITSSVGHIKMGEQFRRDLCTLECVAGDELCVKVVCFDLSF